MALDAHGLGERPRTLVRHDTMANSRRSGRRHEVRSRSIEPGVLIAKLCEVDLGDLFGVGEGRSELDMLIRRS